MVACGTACYCIFKSAMQHLLESIRLEDGVFSNLSYHEQRLQQAQRALFGRVTIQALAHHLNVPDYARRGVYKCRVRYGRAVEQVEFLPYHHRPVRSLRRVHCDTINYPHKYADRRLLNELYAQRGNCDDVLIIKGGLVTDTSYANVVFYDGARWVTPVHPLLRGTQRQYLLDAGLIQEVVIEEEDLRHFQQFQIINAFHAFPSNSYVVSGIG